MSIISVTDQNKTILKDNGIIVMTMTETLKDDTVEIQIDGAMRNDIKHCLGDELRTLILFGKNLVIDMRNATELSASCSEVLLNTQRVIDDADKGCSLILRNIPPKILEKMKETGLSELLYIEKSED